jgi:sRNA-binding carbon storage regulator CsrA
MLVLGFRPDQSVVCYDKDGNPLVTVTVVAVMGPQVRLGFKGDPSIKILRDNCRRRKPRGEGNQRAVGRKQH